MNVFVPPSLTVRIEAKVVVVDVGVVDVSVDVDVVEDLRVALVRTKPAHLVSERGFHPPRVAPTLRV